MKTKKRRRPAILAAALAVLCVLAFGVAKIGYDLCFKRAGPPAETAMRPGYVQPSVQLRYADVDPGTYPREAVAFASGKNTLRGHLYQKENGPGQPRGLVVVCHGLGAGADGYFAETLWFLNSGWRVLAYNNTGSYASDGENGRGIAQSLIDLDAALGYVESRDDLAGLPVVLYGHSWGGYAVAAATGLGHDIAAVVSLAGFDSPAAALYDYAQNKTGIFGVLAFPFFWGYHCSLFGEGWANRSAAEALSASGVPALIIHGTGDNTLRYGVSSIIARRDDITSTNVRYITMQAPGHNGHANLACTPQAAAYAAEKAEQWAALAAKYGGAIPQGEQDAFFEGLDKHRASRLDEELFGAIEAFIREAAESRGG